jgi:predicted HAD superfamily Cof-like phosphohydrolase
MVLEFHNAFGALVASKPVLPDSKVREMRKKILEEEFDEYYEAVADSDRVEQADALGDIAYIACGTAISYGIVPEKSYEYIASDYTTNEMSTDHYVGLLKKSLANYLFAEALNDLDLISKRLNEILYTVSDAAQGLGIPLQQVFNEIHRSNMTKLGDDGKPILREDGKILKSSKYEKPNIAKILEDHVIIDGF